MGDLGSIPRLGRFPGEKNSYQLLYFGLENSMDYIVHGVAKSHTGLSDFHFTAPFVKLYPSSVLCIYVPHLYLFICWWMFRLFPFLAVVNGAAVNSEVQVSL